MNLLGGIKMNQKSPMKRVDSYFDEIFGDILEAAYVGCWLPGNERIDKGSV
jgi:hypothetical protein